jgi:hypothetical protein
MMKKPQELPTWHGVGILSRRSRRVVLEAYDDSTYALAKFEAIPPEIRGSRLVLVTARLTPLTKRQLASLLRSMSQVDTPGPRRGKISS